MSVSNVDIIIARYNEDLHWTLESPFNEYQYIVYNKGPNEHFEKANVKKVINIKNVGRCDHTYLYHIVHNFNNLADINVFFPGSIQLSNKKNKAIDILNRIKNNDYKCAIFIGKYSKNILQEFNNFRMKNHQASDPQNTIINNESQLKPSILRPFKTWYTHHFGDLCVNFYTLFSIFSIHKNDIIQHDITRYQKLLYGLSLHSNPEVGHYFERAWGAVFHPFQFTKVFLVEKLY